jgi:hypothetical protein
MSTLVCIYAGKSIKQKKEVQKRVKDVVIKIRHLLQIHGFCYFGKSKIYLWKIQLSENVKSSKKKGEEEEKMLEC